MKLLTMANPNIDRSSVPGGPGDATVDSFMVRDNVMLSAGAPGMARADSYLIFASIDHYLLSNWPLETAQGRPGPLEHLKVTIAIASTVKKDAPAELQVSVIRNGQELPLKDLPFRVLMEPGRLRWDAGRLFFSSDHPGPVKITFDALAEPHAYGQGDTTTLVE